MTDSNEATITDALQSYDDEVDVAPRPGIRQIVYTSSLALSAARRDQLIATAEAREKLAAASSSCFGDRGLDCGCACHKVDGLDGASAFHTLRRRTVALEKVAAACMPFINNAFFPGEVQAALRELDEVRP